MKPMHTLYKQRRTPFGQSLSEYLLIAALLGSLGLVGVVGFNDGFGILLQQVKGSLTLGGGGAAVAANQTNLQIASAASALPLSNLPTGMPANPAGPSPSPLVQQTNQLQSLSTLLTSMDPANLPEVSGSNSTVDIAQLIASANLLVQQANALAASQPNNSGLNVSDLVFEARKVAAAQFFLAGVTLSGPGTLDPATGQYSIDDPNITAGMALLPLIIAQKPNDIEANKFFEYYNGGYYADNVNNAGQILQVNVYSTDYKAAYQPLKSTITQLNLQTQQANTVVTNGGNINNNANVNGNANQTLNDANAINACQNATCN